MEDDEGIVQAWFARVQERSEGCMGAGEVVGGIFPAVAKYLKHTPDGDETDLELRKNLAESLNNVEKLLTTDERKGDFLVGDGQYMTLLDCNLVPKLYHMSIGLSAFKDNAIDLEVEFPAVNKYMNYMFSRDSFVKTKYPAETVTWGWGNARSS